MRKDWQNYLGMATLAVGMSIGLYVLLTEMYAWLGDPANPKQRFGPSYVLMLIVTFSMGVAMVRARWTPIYGVIQLVGAGTVAWHQLHSLGSDRLMNLFAIAGLVFV